MLSERAELRARVEARQKELEARLAQLKAEGHASKNAAADEIRAKLRELDRALRDGWEHMTEAVAATLNRWLK